MFRPGSDKATAASPSLLRSRGTSHPHSAFPWEIRHRERADHATSRNKWGYCNRLAMGRVSPGLFGYRGDDGAMSCSRGRATPTKHTLIVVVLKSATPQSAAGPDRASQCPLRAI